MDVKREFKEGMRLEAIDPQFLSTIRVASVGKVLKDNYLMIRFDGFKDQDGSDMFCYHRSSPYILPAGFCNRHQIDLQAPFDYKGKFDWPLYLSQTNSEFAPVLFFNNVIWVFFVILVLMFF